MVKIKIKSNPYHKKTEFKTWDDALDEWISIDVITCLLYTSDAADE